MLDGRAPWLRARLHAAAATVAPMTVLVVGAGVSGLSCAAALQAAGHPVAVWSAATSPGLTSDVAAAFWYPYRADPPERVLGWSAASYRHFAGLVGDDAGVTMREVTELVRSAPQAPPFWGAAVAGLRPLGAAEIPAGFAGGWRFEAPVVDTRRYMPWLRARLESAGARITLRSIASLDEAIAAADVVVNCTGLGARSLCADDGVFPIRGQLVHVRDPGLARVVLDEDDPRGITYVVPRGDDCVLGGTADPGDDDLRARDDASAAILARAGALVPELRGATPLRVAVGLRPGRAAVRLEAERIGGATVVHDYGHGGAGVTLSWGCALEVCELVARATR